NNTSRDFRPAAGATVAFFSAARCVETTGNSDEGHRYRGRAVGAADGGQRVCAGELSRQAAPHPGRLCGRRSRRHRCAGGRRQAPRGLGKRVVIENVTGSGGNMAPERVAKPAPDGYTLLLGTSGPFVIHPSLYPKLPFDPVKDFAPITQLCFTANVLVVN